MEELKIRLNAEQWAEVSRDMEAGEEGRFAAAMPEGKSLPDAIANGLRGLKNILARLGINLDQVNVPSGTDLIDYLITLLKAAPGGGLTKMLIIGALEFLRAKFGAEASTILKGAVA